MIRPGMNDNELAALEAYLRVGLRELGASHRPPDSRPAVRLLRAIEAERRRIRALQAGDARDLSTDGPELLTIPEAARRVGIPVSTARDLLARRLLEPRGWRWRGERHQKLVTAEDMAEAVRRSKG